MTEILNSHLTDADNLDVTEDGKYTVTGNGIFDDLMEAVNVHLSAQFNLQRITGSDYATVYLGAMQSAMQNAVGFILGRQKAAEESDMIEAQKSALLQETVAKLIKHYGFKDAYIIDDEIVLGDTSDDGLIDEQIEKTDAEEKLLKQKHATERAQTEESVVNSDGSTVTVNGVVGKQKDLYTEQTKGFYWNAQNKYLKAILDSQGINTNVFGESTLVQETLEGGSHGPLNTDAMRCFIKEGRPNDDGTANPVGTACDGV